MTTRWTASALVLSLFALSPEGQICPVVHEEDPLVPTGDGIGAAFTSLGDLDGDGTVEVIAGIPSPSTQADMGLWLFSFHRAPHPAPGTIASQTKIPLPASVPADLLGGFGSSATTLGDVGSDGTIEIAIGAPGEDAGRGAAYVISVDPHTLGFTVTTRILGSSLGFGPGDGFGSAVAALPNPTGDKHPNLAVGAPGCDDGSTDAGAIVVFDLDGTASVVSSAKTTATSGALPGMEISGGFGAALSNLAAGGLPGDLNGDGIPDLLVGAPADGTGCVWVLYLEGDGTLGAAERIAGGSGGFAGSLDPDAGFGSSIATLSVQAGSRILAVGAPGAAGWATGQGELWYLEIASNGYVLDELRVGPSSGGFAGFPPVDAGLGRSLAKVGDLDQNGANDLLVGAPGGQGGSPSPVWSLFHGETFEPRAVSFGDDNPSDLALTEGEPRIGMALTFSLDDTDGVLGTSFTFLHSGPDPSGNAPVGVPLPGAVGMLHVDLTSATTLQGPLWTPGQPASLGMTLPLDPALAGTSQFVQGAIVGLAITHLTNALRLVIAY